jgi:hypothetical protein
MTQTIDKLERLLEIASTEGISVRCEWLKGIQGGLVRIGKSPILFVDDSLSIQEQWEQVRDALCLLDWSETQWCDEMERLLSTDDSAW